MSKALWMDFAEYPDTGFIFNYYSTRDPKTGVRGSSTGIKHEPSGRSIVSVAPDGYILPILLKELIEELRAAGITPQPRKVKVGVKKIGKPRWSEAQRQSD